MGPTLPKHKEPGEPGGKGGQHQRTEHAFAPSRPPHGERVGAEGREKARAEVPLAQPCGEEQALLPHKRLPLPAAGRDSSASFPGSLHLLS